MVRRTAIGLAIVLGAGLAAPTEAGSTSESQRRAGRVCEPVLPILTQSVTADVEPDGIRSCKLISSADEWSDFCTSNLLACDSYDAGFFDDWTMVAVVVETSSPLVCDNAGPVPWWDIGCLTERRGMLLARVELTLAGAGCVCSSAPQTPTRLYLVEAVPRTTASACRAWQEMHVIECPDLRGQ